MKNNTDELTLLLSGAAALQQRLSLIRNAQTRICIQTFLWQNDASGRLILEECKKASERNIPVNILIDYWVLASSKSRLVKVFDTIAKDNPYFEVRIFNPLLQKSEINSFELLLKVMKDFSSSQKRMHAKLFLSEGQEGILGGRNIGDEYFDLHHTRNFIDCDILYAGNQLSALTDTFDSYWNSNNTIDVNKFNDKNWIDFVLKKQSDGQDDTSLDIDSSYQEHIEETLASLDLTSPSVPCSTLEFYFDSPHIDSEAPIMTGDQLSDVLCSATSSIDIFSPYLIFPAPLLERLKKKIHSNDISIQIVTNSLITSDNLYTYAAAASTKQSILKALSCNLYELSPDLINPTSYVPTYDVHRSRKKHDSKNVASGFGDNPYETNELHSTLHAKVYVIDRKIVCIGAINLDPRSFFINTENFVRIDSNECAENILDHYGRLKHDTNSWIVAPIEENDNDKTNETITFPALSSSTIESMLSPSPLPHCFKPLGTEQGNTPNRFSPDFYEQFTSCGPFPGVDESDKEIQLYFYKALAPLFSNLL